MKKVQILLMLILLGCKQNISPKLNWVEENILENDGGKLVAYHAGIEKSKYLVLMEAGLGDDHTVWFNNNIADFCAEKYETVIYDRAGYGKSALAETNRSIPVLSYDLGKVIEKYSKGRKVILIGHSLGGLIIRDYAIKNPQKVAGMLFVDPSHEKYNEPTKEQVKQIVEVFSKNFGANHGATSEATYLESDFEYMFTLGPLPNVPVVVLTSMKEDAANKEADKANHKTRQDWYDAHETLKTGITDFTHVKTLKAGHYIMKEDPEFFKSNFNVLINKIPVE
ncbi:MAG: alpha/beta hydrolase [Bacteroidetes bacterium]|nr:alpha/beta hydrolase [Bacteroidota bacterium]